VFFKPFPQALILFVQLFNKVFNAQACESAKLFLDIGPYSKLLLDSLILHLHIIDVSQSLSPHIVFIPSEIAITKAFHASLRKVWMAQLLRLKKGLVMLTAMILQNFVGVLCIKGRVHGQR